MEIIAKITHQYGRKQRRPGAKYDATTAHAKFLVAQGLSEYPRPTTPKTATVESKDMAAESVKGSTDADSKRAYKRKDLTAEGKL